MCEQGVFQSGWSATSKSTNISHSYVSAGGRPIPGRHCLGSPQDSCFSPRGQCAAKAAHAVETGALQNRFTILAPRRHYIEKRDTNNKPMSIFSTLSRHMHSLVLEIVLCFQIKPRQIKTADAVKLPKRSASESAKKYMWLQFADREATGKQFMHFSTSGEIQSLALFFTCVRKAAPSLR